MKLLLTPKMQILLKIRIGTFLKRKGLMAPLDQDM